MVKTSDSLSPSTGTASAWPPLWNATRELPRTSSYCSFLPSHRFNCALAWDAHHAWETPTTTSPAAHATVASTDSAALNLEAVIALLRALFPTSAAVSCVTHATSTQRRTDQLRKIAQQTLAAGTPTERRWEETNQAACAGPREPTTLNSGRNSTDVKITFVTSISTRCNCHKTPMRQPFSCSPPTCMTTWSTNSQTVPSAWPEECASER